MQEAKVFKSGNSQAVRIPKELHTDETSFLIQKVGKGMIFYPKDDPWFGLKRSLGSLPDDFMEDRNQPGWDEVEKREDF